MIGLAGMHRPWWTLAALALIRTGASACAGPLPAVADPYPNAASGYAVAIDDQLLWGHRLDGRRAPASLAKLLTAIVLLESNWNPDRLLTISDRAAHATRPRSGVRAGDKVRAEDALMAMLVQSANDACLALIGSTASAQDESSALTAFAELMNAHALKLGMRDSHFVQPCGFDADGQYSTVSDLLRLAKAAYADPRIARVVSQAHAALRTAAGMELSFNNTNQLLGRLDGVVGMKTGYTARAGYCLIALAEQSGHRVWLVMLDSRERWWTAHRILSDGLAAAARRDAHNRGT